MDVGDDDASAGVIANVAGGRGELQDIARPHARSLGIGERGLKNRLLAGDRRGEHPRYTTSEVTRTVRLAEVADGVSSEAMLTTSRSTLAMLFGVPASCGKSPTTLTAWPADCASY